MKTVAVLGAGMHLAAADRQRKAVIGNDTGEALGDAAEVDDCATGFDLRPGAGIRHG